MLRRKEKGKKQNKTEQICKVKQRQIKIHYKGKRPVGKANKGINVEKKIIGLKIKIKKKERRKKGQLYKTAKAQHRGRGL